MCYTTALYPVALLLKRFYQKIPEDPNPHRQIQNIPGRDDLQVNVGIHQEERMQGRHDQRLRANIRLFLVPAHLCAVVLFQDAGIEGGGLGATLYLAYEKLVLLSCRQKRQSF